MEPIFTAHLFPKLDALLIELLRSIAPADWQKRTISPSWSIHDIAAHLLDGNLRALSMLRDGHFGETPGDISSYQELLGYLNKLNADWVAATRRLSPGVLIDLLEKSGKQYADFLTTLEPFEPAAFSVAWAGEAQSANWFHIAREYTEKWHHQQQIRLALGRETALYEKELYFPYLDTSMRALPYHYRSVSGREGEQIQFIVEGPGGGVWCLRFVSNNWLLVPATTETPASEVRIPGAIAWRIFSKGISPMEAEKLVSISGRQDAGARILDMLAVMA